MTEFNELEQVFNDAVTSGNVESIQVILESFDKTCRRLVEQETDQDKKRKLVNTCIIMQKSWQSQIIKLKAKVKGELADIKSNGKKIQKYLTSY